MLVFGHHSQDILQEPLRVVAGDQHTQTSQVLVAYTWLVDLRGAAHAVGRVAHNATYRG